jgi:hypothetical protein
MLDVQITINQLQQLSMHELYRLLNWIDNEINRPQKIYEIRNNFKIGDRLQWFDAKNNAYKYGVILNKKRTQVTIRSEDEIIWEIPYYLLNLANTNATLPINHAILTKNDFSIDDAVEFNNDGTPYNGIIIRLNHKTATVRLTNGTGEWRVSYRCLSKLIDSKANYIAGELL